MSSVDMPLKAKTTEKHILKRDNEREGDGVEIKTKFSNEVQWRYIYSRDQDFFSNS